MPLLPSSYEEPPTEFVRKEEGMTKEMSWTERVELNPGKPAGANIFTALMTKLPTRPCVCGCGRSTAGLVCRWCQREGK